MSGTVGGPSAVSAAEEFAGLPSRLSWDRTLAGIEVRYGEGRLDELGAAAAALDGHVALLVVDGGMVAAGHAERARTALAGAGLEVVVYDGVSANPNDDQVSAVAAELADRAIDLVVAVGGGSTLDFGKAMNFLLSNGGRMEDYWGYDKAELPMLPSIGVPTTAGTGSEAQSYALISQSGTHRKMACGDAKARFRIVVLDPGLLATVPRGVAAAAGMDALSHSLESLVTKVRTAKSVAISQRSFDLLAPVMDQLAADPSIASPFDDPELRADASLGAYLAGAAIDHSMLGAAHASANPLTARFGVPHGEAIGLMLAPVIRYNRKAVDRQYRRVDLGGAVPLARRIEATRTRIGLPTSLTQLGISRDDLPRLAEAATREWTGTFNPRPLEADDFHALYEEVL